jgi:hypothetical protein
MKVEYWHSYLQPVEFVIKTDQPSSAYIDDQWTATPWQQKDITNLMDLQFRILYGQAILSWLIQLTQGYGQDPSTRKLLGCLTTGGKVEYYTLTQGVIRYKGRIWLCTNKNMQQSVISVLHDNTSGGRSGFPVTYRCMKTLYTWPMFGVRSSTVSAESSEDALSALLLSPL